MKRAWAKPAKVLGGLMVSAMCALPQAYTISAKPGVVNYIEGTASINDRPVTAQSDKAVFLNANDVLTTDAGKAEVLLTPGVFLRVGTKTEIRMISPSLVDTKVELKSGDAMVEVDDLVKDNNLSVLTHGATVQITKPGLYRISADPAVAAALEGKAQVAFGDRQVELNKGHEVYLDEGLKTAKFDSKKSDELYAWSNTRSAYDAASSYQTARNVSVNSFGGGWGDYGYAGSYGSGWMWNSGFNSFAWLPGNGAFYSPFGYGFYGAGMVPYAPVIYSPIYGGGGGGRVVTKNTPVPVNPNKPPALGGKVLSPAANHVASIQTVHSFASTGFATASGARVAAGRGGMAGANPGNGGGRVASSSGAGMSAPSSGFSSPAARSGGGTPAMSSAGAGGGGHASSAGGGGHH